MEPYLSDAVMGYVLDLRQQRRAEESEVLANAVQLDPMGRVIDALAENEGSDRSLSSSSSSSNKSSATGASMVDSNASGSANSSGGHGVLSSSSRSIVRGADPYTLWDYYLDCWLPFGRVLTDMEAEGVKVDR
jgi:hypothetical protein